GETWRVTCQHGSVWRAPSSCPPRTALCVRLPPVHQGFVLLQTRAHGSLVFYLLGSLLDGLTPGARSGFSDGMSQSWTLVPAAFAASPADWPAWFSVRPTLRLKSPTLCCACPIVRSIPAPVRSITPGCPGS